MEEWKEVAGHEGRYLVSSLGNVKSLTRAVDLGKGRFRVFEGRVLKPMPHKGYFRVCLGGLEKRKFYKIHRLVALAFIPNPNNYNQINHIDGNKTNNHVDNLEWCTAKQNTAHARATGLRKDIGKGSVVSTSIVNCRGQVFECANQAYKHFNLRTSSGIYLVCQGKRKTAGTYGDGTKVAWKYL